VESSTFRKVRRFLLGPKGRTLGLGLLVAGFMALLTLLPFGQALENQVLDLCYRLRSPIPQPVDLLVVAIDEPSFQELQRPWPWPRRLHAEVVRQLSQKGARLIVFDIIFADATTPEDDQLLAQAFKEANNVVLGETIEVAKDPRFTRRIRVTPLKTLQQNAKQVGLSMITPDADGVVRRFRLRLGGVETLPSVVTRLVGQELRLPSDFTGLINYAGPARSIDTVSFYQVIDPVRPLPESRIRDRIVLVGRSLEASATPQAQADAFYTPFWGGGGQLMAGVEIQGNIIHTLLTGSWGRELLPQERLGLLVAVLLLASLILARLKPLAGLTVVAATLVLLVATTLTLFSFMHFWLPPVLLAAGLVLVYSGHVLGHYFVEAREKRWLRHAFGRYVSPSVVEIISDHPERLELGGEEVEATVLFADLEGFTQLSETMPPQTLIRLLNDYFTPMTQIIMASRGTLDKYIGDALMALWGAPVPLPDHALRACRAALEMQEAMIELQAGWETQGLPRVAARLGLHTGPVVAGNVGSRERFNYTVLGDTVNLASRLEGVNKVYGTRILLSEETCRQVKDALLVREVDLVQVKGRVQPVTIYELLGPLPPEEIPPWLDLFTAALQSYRRRQWQEAYQTFGEVLRLRSEDRPSQVFRERCRSCTDAPPPADWQGVFILDAK